jgi:hypothetical protein
MTRNGVETMSACNCAGNTLFRPSRREFVTVGALGVLGFGLADLLESETARAEDKGAAAPKAKSIIHIFLPGGMAHQDFTPNVGARHFDWQTGEFGLWMDAVVQAIRCFALAAASS